LSLKRSWLNVNAKGAIFPAMELLRHLLSIFFNVGVICFTTQKKI